MGRSGGFHLSDGKVATPPLAKPQWEAATLASDEVNAIIINNNNNNKTATSSKTIPPRKSKKRKETDNPTGLAVDWPRKDAMSLHPPEKCRIVVQDVSQVSPSAFHSPAALSPFDFFVKHCMPPSNSQRASSYPWPWPSCCTSRGRLEG